MCVDTSTKKRRNILCPPQNTRPTFKAPNPSVLQSKGVVGESPRDQFWVLSRVADACLVGCMYWIPSLGLLQALKDTENHKTKITDTDTEMLFIGLFKTIGYFEIVI